MGSEPLSADSLFKGTDRGKKGEFPLIPASSPLEALTGTLEPEHRTPRLLIGLGVFYSFHGRCQVIVFAYFRVLLLTFSTVA